MVNPVSIGKKNEQTFNIFGLQVLVYQIGICAVAVGCEILCDALLAKAQLLLFVRQGVHRPLHLDREKTWQPSPKQEVHGVHHLDKESMDNFT
jgi:hypothetical protein